MMTSPEKTKTTTGEDQPNTNGRRGGKNAASVIVRGWLLGARFDPPKVVNYYQVFWM